MRRKTGAIAIAAALLAFAPGLAGNAARAHETTDGTVNAFHCIAGDGGFATITPGSEVVIRIAWATQLLGDQKTFLDAQTTAVGVNDAQMSDVSDGWSPPASAGATYVSVIEIPTGVTLASGEQMRFTAALVLKRGLTEPAIGVGEKPIIYEAGLQFGGTCTVSAE